jgi:hypothetical protein
MSFSASLDYGRAAEGAIALWLRGRGLSVLPVYEKVINTGKGPQLFMPNKALIAPDLFVFGNGKCFWIEAKHKTAFSWHRNLGCWTTGIDLRHYRDYCEVDDSTPWPVWLLFLHEGGQAKDSPPESPAGLFGETLAKLRRCESHRSDRWGASGMVYWARDSLQLLASLQDVRRQRAP